MRCPNKKAFQSRPYTIGVSNYARQDVRCQNPIAPVRAGLLQTKFAVVVETAAFNETELSEYCRSKGLYPEQVKAWRDAAIAVQDEHRNAASDRDHLARGYRKQIKQLEREIARKNSALAEAAALLILQKKMRALWEGGEDE